MKTSELLKRIGNKAPCLACDYGLGKLQQDGFSDFVYLIRRIAEAVWSESVSDEKKESYNELFAELVRIISGEAKYEYERISHIVEELDRSITETELSAIWKELKTEIFEAKDS